jgi:hypothetical protein
MPNPLTDEQAWRREVLRTLQALLAEHRALVEQLRALAERLRARTLER